MKHIVTRTFLKHNGDNSQNPLRYCVIVTMSMTIIVTMIVSCNNLNHHFCDYNLNLQTLLQVQNYFNGLLNNGNNREELPPQLPVQGPIPEIHEDEVNTQIGNMKANKATGPDQLPIDIIKLLKKRGTTWMTACLNNIILKRIPPDWREYDNTNI